MLQVLVQVGSKLEERVLAVLLGSEWTAGRAGRVKTGNPTMEGGTGVMELEHGGWTR